MASLALKNHAPRLKLSRADGLKVVLEVEWGCGAALPGAAGVYRILVSRPVIRIIRIRDVMTGVSVASRPNQFMVRLLSHPNFPLGVFGVRHGQVIAPERLGLARSAFRIFGDREQLKDSFEDELMRKDVRSWEAMALALNRAKSYKSSKE